MVVLIFHEALCQFGQDLKHEQQLSETMADMFSLLYTTESVICRAKQMPQLKNSNFMAHIARVHVAEVIIGSEQICF